MEKSALVVRRSFFKGMEIIERKMLSLRGIMAVELLRIKQNRGAVS